MENQRCLQFKYYDKEKAIQLERILQSESIDYVLYDDGQYILFIVTRSGKKWNDIMRIINDIHSPKYTHVNTCIENGVEYVLL